MANDKKASNNLVRPVAEPRYIDPMVDYGFKKIFKESGNKQLLIRPLNSIFGLDIADLEIGETERLGETAEDRSACFDLYCTSSDGKKFIVEVQLARQEYFLERALYYTTFPIAQSARKGHAGGRWDYDLPRVFFLGLLNFDFRDLHGQGSSDPARYVHRFSLRDEETGDRMTDRLEFAFMEIRRFAKSKDECESFEEKFLYMMKNMPRFAEEPDLWNDPYFESMLKEAEYARMAGPEKEQYRKAMRRDWDYWNTIDYARKESRAEGHAEGHAEGLAEGRAEGLAEGHAEGLAEGETKGRLEEQHRIARRMLAAGLSAELVSESTSLPLEQVLSLQEGSLDQAETE